MAQARLVAAVSPAVRQRIRNVVPDCQLRFVRNRDELLREIDHCDMLILGVHFDESTAVAALERVDDETGNANVRAMLEHLL